MQLVIPNSDLSAAVDFAARSSDAKAVGAFASLLIAADGGRVVVTGMGGKGIGRATAWAMVSAAGSVTVPTTGMVAALDALGKGSVDMTVDGESRVTLKCGRRKVELAGAPADLFPAVGALPPADALAFKAAELNAAIQRVSYACGSDVARPAMTGVLLDATGADGVSSLVGVDGNRMAVAEVATAVPVTEGVLIPQHVVEAIAAIVRERPAASLKLGIAGPYVWCVSEGREVAGLRIEGDFPPWRDYYERVSGECTGRAVAGRADLAEAFGAVAKLREGVEACVVEFEKDGVVPSVVPRLKGARACEAPVGLVEYTAASAAEPLQLNPKFVAEALAAMGEDRATLRWNDAMSPLLVESGTCRAVIMTMR